MLHIVFLPWKETIDTRTEAVSGQTAATGELGRHRVTTETPAVGLNTYAVLTVVSIVFVVFYVPQDAHSKRVLPPIASRPEAGRQADRKTGRQADRQTGRQAAAKRPFRR